jgi:hypothetical protein
VVQLSRKANWSVVQVSNSEVKRPENSDFKLKAGDCCRYRFSRSENSLSGMTAFRMKNRAIKARKSVICAHCDFFSM